MLRRFKPDLFIIGMLAAIALAALWPTPGAQGGFLHPELLTKVGVALIFFLNGAMLSFGALRDGVMKWRLHVIIQASTFLYFPLLGLLFLTALDHLTPFKISFELRLGFFFLCAIPSTVSSSVAMTSAAHGNVPVAVFNATLSSLIGIVLTPLWMGLLLTSHGQALDISGVFVDLSLWMVLPLVMGQLMRPWIGAWLKQHKKWAQGVDRGTILLLVYTSFCDSFARGIWSRTEPATLILVALAALSLFFMVLLSLWALCDRFHIAPDYRSAVVFCGTKKSLAAGVPMAALIFTDHTAQLGLILLPIMLY
ncbi:MAG: bile acid:sodium symporter family protein, partial [Asticcacaulis sp.]